MRKEYRNVPTHIIIDGQDYGFKSKFESRWAQYLQFLKESGQIFSWHYEKNTFYFKDEATAPVQYTPDFLIREKFGCPEYDYWQECKGYFDSQTNTKFRRLQSHYPGIVIDLVLQSKPKRGKNAHKIMIAQKYVRRVIYANEIFKQLGRIITV